MSRRSRLVTASAIGGLLVASLVVVPALQAAPEAHLTAAGDFGARAATGPVLDKIAEIDPDAHIALGDLAYEDVAPETAWCDYIKSHVGDGFPFQLISGNHESLDVADGAINNYSACLPNQIPGVVGTYGREYFMDLPGGSTTPLVRVVNASPALLFEDGRWQYAQGSGHYNWVANAIDSARAKGIPWVVVSAHMPCFSVGTYSCPSPRDFYDLLLDKKVDLVLTGHEHAYMRTKQLRSGVTGCTTIPTGTFDADCVADGDDTYTAGQGTVFATVGTGGVTLRDVNAADPEAGYFAAFSGLNSNPAHGLLDVDFTDTELSAAFVPTSGSFTDAFTVTKGGPPANQPPTAAFTVSGTGLTRSFNASGSSDPDGTLVGYAWDFGDQATGTGATPQHTYTQPGTYPVTLTVTDNGGLTGTTQQNVTVTNPSSLATDTFGRTTAAGWGQADAGGTWSVTGSTANYTVSGGVGRMRMALAATTTAWLPLQQTAADVTVTLSPDKVQTGGGTYSYVSGRRVAGNTEYRALLRFFPNGDLAPSIRRTVSGTETTLVGGSTAVKWAVGDQINVRFQATGTSPTTLRLKVWKNGTTEPAGWLVQTTDSTAALQSQGGIGVSSYLSSSATNGPVTLLVDNLTAVVP